MGGPSGLSVLRLLRGRCLASGPRAVQDGQDSCAEITQLLSWCLGQHTASRARFSGQQEKGANPAEFLHCQSLRSLLRGCVVREAEAHLQGWI